ncbi:MAG: hypothetical protein AAFY59_10590 [Pseudomonadota bacterium]
MFLLEEGDAVGDFGLSFEPGDLCVSAKGDLRRDTAFPISGVTGLGVDRLCGLIADVFAERASVVASATRLRQKRMLEDADAALERAEQTFRDVDGPVDIGAEHLRHAMFSLDALIGRIGVEDMLDVVFSSFCIGK